MCPNTESHWCRRSVRPSSYARPARLRRPRHRLREHPPHRPRPPPPARSPRRLPQPALWRKTGKATAAPSTSGVPRDLVQQISARGHSPEDLQYQNGAIHNAGHPRRPCRRECHRRLMRAVEHGRRHEGGGVCRHDRCRNTRHHQDDGISVRSQIAAAVGHERTTTAGARPQIVRAKRMAARANHIRCGVGERLQR